MASSRTSNSIKNIKSGFIVQFVNKFMSFISRSVFIYCLNTEYLGVNGLFSNVLSILSFAELGIGSAIIYNMYKPVATNDIEKVKSLMKLYKKTYNLIGIIIFVLGLCLIPFMGYIVTDVPNIKENIIFIYLLFLFDTASSYFFTYKKSIIIANQKQSVINNIDSIFYLLRNVIQIIFLFMTRNFIIYLCIQILGTFLENVYISHKANKMYPYLKERNIKALKKSERKHIFENVKSLAIYQFGAVVMNGTDNILISAMLGVSIVGLVSNYTLILNSVKQVISTALNGLTASVGNLNATSNNEKKEIVYLQLTFAYYILYSFCSLAFICIINPFVNIWLGNKYVMSFSIALALGLTLFIEGIRMPGFMFRTTLGLFEKSKFTPYIGAITNIILSIILCKFCGLVGIFIATSISQLVSYFWIDPYIIYKYDFKKSSKTFFMKMLKYFLAFTMSLVLCYIIIELLNINKIFNLLLSIITVILIPNIINYLSFHKTPEYINLSQRVRQRFEERKIRKNA